MRRVRQGLLDVRVGSEMHRQSGLFLRALRGCRVVTTALALFSALCILETSCISQTHTPYRGGQAPRLLQAALPWRPENPRSKISAVPREGTRTHAVLLLSRPRPCGDSSENELGALAYLSRTSGTKRWVVVLPIWGSSTYPSHKIVRRLLGGTHGSETNVLWIQGPTYLVRYAALKEAATEAEFLAEASRTASCIDATVKDVRAFIDWVMMQPDTDPRRVGIVGFSIGGIVASLVMGRDQRLAAGVFVMVGGHLDEIVAHCKWGQREVREHAAAAFGWNVEKLKSVIKAPLSALDPVLVAGRIDPAAVLYIDSGYDGCIPQSSRDDLWRAMGEPERVTLGYDHRNSFLTMTFLGFDVTTRRIVAFLDRRLGKTEHLLPEKASTTATSGKAP
jgi:hypothetical protein